MSKQREIIVDSFAGGGGASTGIEMATGRYVDIAINHDEAAILMHKTNHPHTKHYCENIWEVDPVKVTEGRPVGLMWASPDCRHFSKAKGGKPVEKKIRGLAWVVLKWAGKVHPRVIILENVEEFVTWGPVRKGKPVKSKKGITFEKFKSQLQSLGYKVEHRELRACDYGAPTTRKRFFMIARCDGKPIVWPEPTHGDPDSLEVRTGFLKPWRTAAECIDWSIPCPSIFERKKPLAENTLRRIAKGIQKYVIDNPNPFIIQVNHSGQNFRGQKIIEPLSTVTAKHGYGIVTPVISQIGQTGGGDRLRDIQEPLSTIVSKTEHMLVAPLLTQYHSETINGGVRGQEVNKPIMTLDASNRYGLVTSNLIQLNNNCDGVDINKPLPTVTAGGGHIGEVRTFLMTYYGNGDDVGQRIDEPLRTITAKDRFGIVTIHGQDYQIVDIGMRMLTPRELFRAQGFPDDYIIDRDYTGKPYPKSAQVARCGNAVPPQFAKALVRANLPEMCSISERLWQIS